MKNRLRAGMVGVAGMAALGFAQPAMTQNAIAQVAETDAGHQVGAPDATVSLIEFFSYTCPHCGVFAREGDGPLQIAYIMPRKVKVEYRPMIHDPVDLTLTMMVDCAGPENFVHYHSAVMARQTKWLARAHEASQGERELWSQAGTEASARRTIASSLNLYDIFAGRGLRQTTLDQCLSNQTKANELMMAANENRTTFGRIGTPSFAIDGVLLDGVHRWADLQPFLDESLSRAEPDE